MPLQALGTSLPCPEKLQGSFSSDIQQKWGRPAASGLVTLGGSQWPCTMPGQLDLKPGSFADHLETQLSRF